MSVIDPGETVNTRLRWMRMAGGVLRYHTWPMHQHQNLAAHSHGVAVLVDMLVPDASANVLRAALYHDLSEFVTGDIPSPAKWAYPELRAAANAASTDVEEKVGLRMSISEFEMRALRWCDMAELVLHSLHEMKMGNRYADIMVRNGLAKLKEWGSFNMQSDELLSEIEETFEDYKEGVWE